MHIAKLTTGIVTIVFTPILFLVNPELFLFACVALAAGITSTAGHKVKGSSIACFTLYVISEVLAVAANMHKTIGGKIVMFYCGAMVIMHLVAFILLSKKQNESLFANYCVYCGSQLQSGVCTRCNNAGVNFADCNILGNQLSGQTHNPMLEYGLVKYKTDIGTANMLIQRLHESVRIMEETIYPDIFFGRLHYCFDVLLELMTYRDEVFGNNCTPEQQYWIQYDFIETRVNEFLDRAYSAAVQGCRTLKTAKGINKRLKNWYITMEAAFNNCNLYWTGSSGMPHYNGILYTDLNLEKLEGLEATCCIDEI